MYGLNVDEKRCRYSLVLNRSRFFIVLKRVIASEVQKKLDEAAAIDDKAAKRKAAAAEKNAYPSLRKRVKKILMLLLKLLCSI